MKKFAAPALILSGLLALGMTACAPNPDTKEDAKPSPSVAQFEDGTVAKPGDVVPLGEWFTYDYLAYDDTEATLQARLVSVDAATPEQQASAVAAIPQLEGHDVSLLTIEQRKVDGGDITDKGDDANFAAATTDGVQAWDGILAGWDQCLPPQFTAEFNSGDVISTGCLIGAVVNEQDELGGVIWAGSFYEEDNPFAANPVFLTQ